MFKSEIIADSIGEHGLRLTTFVVTFPRIILAEVNTHRTLSRNSASSRAIPFSKMVKMVQDNPFIPLRFQKDHKGMQGTEYFEGAEEEQCKQQWLMARDDAVKNAFILNDDFGATKQLCNRILETFMWQTAIISGTDWGNFFALRAHEAAEIHFQKIAHMMLDEYNNSTPKKLKVGEWHIPFGDKIDGTRLLNDFEDYNPEIGEVGLYTAEIEELKRKIATARCARVSYNNFEGTDDYKKDVQLHDTLARQGHWSPFEHIAQCMEMPNFSGNFKGFRQYRKQFKNENKLDSRIKKFYE